ncbi:hypothetical protein [Nocardioides sp.]|uniref:hypothetical protein n=1 Tax=Nocardioides sp. TaxID=35761 RepID=UPI002B2744C2|nr:hypothetical protein [Nocardioides sp.]
MIVQKITATEMVQSLTGFEEIAIDQTMRVDPYTDGERKPMLVLRALVFVMHKREGHKDHEAREYALSMPMSELSEVFADETPDLDPEEPETPSGEDSAPSE